jgi:hypothetical protein
MLSYEEHLQEIERQTTTLLDDIDISIWVGKRQNDVELQAAIEHIRYNNAKLFKNERKDSNKNLHNANM